MVSADMVEDALASWADVSLFAQHSGGFVQEFTNVTVHVVPGEVPTTALPAISVPVIVAPVPQEDMGGVVVAEYSMCAFGVRVMATYCETVEVGEIANPNACPAFDMKIRSLALDVAAQSFAELLTPKSERSFVVLYDPLPNIIPNPLEEVL